MYFKVLKTQYIVAKKSFKKSCKKTLKKLKDQLLLEVNMKDSNTKGNREVLLDLIQIIPQEGKFIFYLKTDNKSYL